MQKHKLSNGILLDELHAARHRYVTPSCSVMALDAEWSLMAGSTEFGAGHTTPMIRTTLMQKRAKILTNTT